MMLSPLILLVLLVRASVDGAIVVALVWIVSRTITALTPRARTALWWCAAAKFIVALIAISPVVLPVLPAADQSLHALPAAATSLAARAVEGSAPANASGPMTATAIGLGSWWIAALATVWGCGFAVSIALAGWRWRQLRVIVRQSRAASPALTAMGADLSARLSLRAAPEIRLTPAIDTPLVTGIFTPLVLLPADRFEALGAHQQRMVICHELAHIKRRDLWFGCAPALAERIFFFHPFVHVAVREYALWREATCDAAVVDVVGATPHDYGRLLLDLGVAPRRGVAVAAGASSSFANLKRRIAMLRHESSPSTRSRLTTMAAVGIAVAALVPIRLGARSIAAPDQIMAAASSVDSPRSTDQGKEKDNSSHLNYVLLLDDHSSMMSGSMNDISRARQFKRAGEQVMWFRQDGREYVVRDPAALEQIKEVWKPVQEIGNAQGKLGAQQGALGAQQGELGAKQGALGAQQGALGARQGDLGARQGVLGSREAKTAAERQAIDRESHTLETEMRELDRKMQELDAKMREFDEPMRKLGDQMDELGKQMDVLSKQMDEASKRAEGEMQTILERLVATGVAQPVK
jgi:beta-lactamase regulating signal transducer with metallopeptidase domain